jgi:CRP-like cAMP-binding protein
MSELQNEKLGYLRNIDIYQGLTDAEIVCIAKNSHDKTIQKNNLIYTPHEDNQYIYVLKRGEVQLYHSKDGNKVVFDIIGPGTVFGGFSSESRRPNHFAECVRNSFLCVTPVNEFLTLVSKRPEMMLNLMQKMSERISEYERKLEVSTGTASEKIMYELARLKEKRSHNFMGKFFAQPLKVTHERLAIMTGLNRVTVTRTMDVLKKANKIQVNDKTKEITIMD